MSNCRIYTHKFEIDRCLDSLSKKYPIGSAHLLNVDNLDTHPFGYAKKKNNNNNNMN